MKLTKDFSTEEFLISKEYPELLSGVMLTQDEIDKLYTLCAFGLQPIRDAYGPVVILSGFRTPELNRAVNGTIVSQHMRAEAVDFTVPGKVMARVFDTLLKWPGQCLFYTKKRFIHLALPRLGVQTLHTTK